MFARIICAICALALLSAGVAHAADSKSDDKKKWDVEAPLGPTKTVEFDTDEGTWMNLDVSPDGKQIAFDLLGDIYIMPLSGGKATLLRGGPAYEVQPRFSPDGTRICYTSDKDGADNVWIMNRDGSEPRQVTKEDFRLVNNGVWTPDGNYIVAKKHFTSTRSLGAGEMWLYHESGGEGLQITKRRNDQQDVGEPWVSPDGRYVYFSEDTSPGPYFQYNKDPNGDIYVIRRVDRESGEIKNIVAGPGGAVRPQVSPDGKTIAYVHRVRTKTVLYTHDLASGAQYPVWDGLSHDQMETWATFGVYPNFQWMPDGTSIVIWAKGRIHRVDIATRKAVNIPFQVHATQMVNDALRFKQDVSPATFEAKMLRHGDTSPDGRWFVFSAVGHIWKKRLPDGKPVRITKDERWEYYPSFSADAKWIVYTTWSNDRAGSINRVKLDGGGMKTLTTRPGFYYTPRYSPDGTKIVFDRGRGNAILGFTHGTDPGLYWMPAEGGEATLIRESGESPRFSRDGKRVYFMEGIEDNKSAYKSVRLDGGDERTLFSSKYANQYVPSPDEEWLAFTELFQAYIIPFPKTGKEVDLSGKEKAIPIKRVTRDAGSFLHWSSDSSKLHWTIGPQYFTRAIAESFEFVPGAPDSIAPPDTTGIGVGLVLDADVPTGVVALTNARIITMKGDEVIEKGTIVVDRNRITAVGASVEVPKGAKVIDCSGKTIMPGLIDVHAHMWHSDITPAQSWLYLANLAFGVTTTHDPSNPTETVFTNAEMVRMGELVGPRVFSTGTILYGADGDFKAVVNSLDDARSHLRRMKAVGAFSVKSYNQPRRNQRQQVIKAARELEMMVVPEGGSFFFHNMTMILDGHTGIEHTIPVAPIYKDVTTLWGASKTGSTPTLVVGYGGLWGENYWYQKSNVWENERLLTFTPRPVVDERSRRRTMVPDDEFNHVALARNCKDLIDAGASVQLGAHGQLQGLGAHWELWMFTQGGMSNMEALHCATSRGAWYIGMDHDLGSLETGKLADLIVLDKNPLDDIHNSETVRYTMINGRIYDAHTMNEIGNHARERLPFYWEMPGASDAFVWQGDAHGYMHVECGCFAR
ncbi:MAG: amidohydrolase family protein [Candidatus Krumholzibacteria bacterium]|nr:amidohydrolase family protein [Candidatus Krumholzibacteria bacterium]MDH5268732.1 amidohydrolase family protein [Candidatus Krumholzibacteria bacterium]